MFGSAPPPQSETTPFHPRSPYAVAKVAASGTRSTTARRTACSPANGILFNHESPRRGETFVTRKITRALARIKAGLQDKLYLGNLDAKRDWGFAGDYVEAMWMMLQVDEPDDFVIASGETHSVREFLEAAFEHAGMDWEPYVEIDPRYFRPAEVDVLLGDPSKAKRAARLGGSGGLRRAGADHGRRRHRDAREPARRQGHALQPRGHLSRMPPRRALVTGIGGQDGSYLAELLLERDYEVFGIVRHGRVEDYENLAAVRDQVRLVRADVLDQRALTGALEQCRPQEVYNLASVSFVPASWDQPVLTAEFAAVGVTVCSKRSARSIRRSASTRRPRARSSASRARLRKALRRRSRHSPPTGLRRPTAT